MKKIIGTTIKMGQRWYQELRSEILYFPRSLTCSTNTSLRVAGIPRIRHYKAVDTRKHLVNADHNLYLPGCLRFFFFIRSMKSWLFDFNLQPGECGLQFAGVVAGKVFRNSSLGYPSMVHAVKERYDKEDLLRLFNSVVNYCQGFDPQTYSGFPITRIYPAIQPCTGRMSDNKHVQKLDYREDNEQARGK
jgi:hypothetical protein